MHNERFPDFKFTPESENNGEFLKMVCNINLVILSVPNFWTLYTISY